MKKAIKTTRDLVGAGLLGYVGAAAVMLAIDHYQQRHAASYPDTLHLCETFTNVSLGSTLLCDVHELPDGRYAIIERGNDITPRLLDNYIGLQNGTINSQFEEPLPLDDGQNFMHWDFSA